MNSVELPRKVADASIREPEMVRLLRAWENLQPEQKEDLVYLAQSMANRNRRAQRSQKALGKAA